MSSVKVSTYFGFGYFVFAVAGNAARFVQLFAFIS